MSQRYLTIAAAMAAFVLLSQGNVDAGFLVEHGNTWHAVGDDVGAGPIAPEAGDHRQVESTSLAKVLSQFLVLDAAQFGRVGCAAPGGMSSSPSGDSAGQSGAVFLTVSLVRLLGGQSSMWLRIEGRPQIPLHLSSGILRPPRSLLPVG